jgi:hypothetical protein
LEEEKEVEKVPGSQRWQHLLLLIATGAPSVCVCVLIRLVVCVFLLACAKLSFRGSNRKPKKEKNSGLSDPPFAPFEMTPGELPWTPPGQKKTKKLFFWLFYFFSRD